MTPTCNPNDTHIVSVRLMTTLAQMADYEAHRIYRLETPLGFHDDILEIEFRKRGDGIGTAYAWYTRDGLCLGTAERERQGKFNDNRWGVKTTLIHDFTYGGFRPRDTEEQSYLNSDFFGFQRGPVQDMRKRVAEVYDNHTKEAA
jgi:hypothetical protein